MKTLTLALFFLALPALATDPDCPLRFPKAGLCGALEFASAPTAQAPVKFSLSFWNESDTRGTLVAVQPLHLIFEMTCCRTPTVAKFTRGADGVYRGQVVLEPKNYWAHVQVGGKGGERATVDVSVK